MDTSISVTDSNKAVMNSLKFYRSRSINKLRIHFAVKNYNNKEQAMSRNHLLQDPFLNELRKEKVQVSIFLVNGIKLHGIIDSFDPTVVMLKNTITQMVYKHAISTVVPARMVQIPTNSEDLKASDGDS